MISRRRFLALGATGLAAAVTWTSLGTFSVASGKEKPITIARAHTGERSPSFDKPIFLLMLGGDARRGNPQRVRADAIHLVGIDPVARKASIVGVPRDSYVDVPGRGKQKINAATYFGGPDLMVKAVERLSGCRFDYYTLTSFSGFRNLVDEFGGITIDVKRRLFETRFSKINLSPGVQTLKGADALAYARARHVRPRGDFDRSVAQGELMVGALGDARKNYAAKPGTALRDLAVLRRHLTMNIPLDEALKLGLIALKIKPEDVTNIVVDGASETVPGAGSIVTISQLGRNQLVDVCTDGLLDQS